jgi:carboxypeptidase C (cathepsin A)
MVEEDPHFPISDWQYQVANGDTQRGYADWLESQRCADDSTEGRDRCRMCDTILTSYEGDVCQACERNPQGWHVSQPMRLNMVVHLNTDDKQEVREEAYKVSEFLEKMLECRDGAEFGNQLVTEFSIEPDGYVSVEPIEEEE